MNHVTCAGNANKIALGNILVQPRRLTVDIHDTIFFAGNDRKRAFSEQDISAR
jgi:hypothetical protein